MEDYYSKIESYLLGELPEIESKKFEDAIREDPLLATAVNEHEELLSRLKALRTRNKVKVAIQAKSENKEIVRNIPIWMRVAASILILVSFVWIIYYYQSGSGNQLVQTPSSSKDSTSSQSDQIADTTELIDINDQTSIAINSERNLIIANDYYSPPAIDNTRSDVENTNNKTKIEQATEAFSHKKYNQVIKLLSNVKAEGNEEQIIYLKAHAYFNARQFDSAGLEFKKLENSLQYRSEASWNYLLSKIAQGNQTQEIRSLLQNMIRDHDFPYYEKAIKLNKVLQSNYEK
jgi:hypothetical protein